MSNMDTIPGKGKKAKFYARRNVGSETIENYFSKAEALNAPGEAEWVISVTMKRVG